MVSEMAKTGPPRKPAAINRLNGNPGRRAQAITEPKFPSGTPEPPGALTDRSREHWDYAVRMMSHVPGMLTQADRDVLYLYACAWETFYSAQEAIARDGLLSFGENGNPYINPAVNIQSAAMKFIKQTAEGYGFTPSSRSGKQFGGGESEFDPYLAMLQARDEN